jgi:hypothetical protein
MIVNGRVGARIVVLKVPKPLVTNRHRFNGNWRIRLANPPLTQTMIAAVTKRRPSGDYNREAIEEPADERSENLVTNPTPIS